MTEQAYCPVCNVKLQHDDEAQLYRCPSCSKTYDPNREIMSYEDDFTSSHEDEFPEIGGVSTQAAGLIAANDEEDPSLIDQLHKKDRINRGGNVEKWD